MTIERKLLSTSPSDDAPDVAEAFSTHLYTGNGGTNVINNGIDLAGEGGMVWAKCRSATGNHSIFDTERGASKLLYGLGTAAETTSSNSLTSFNSNGFTLGADDTDGVNKNTRSHVAWTFRKKKKFFDVVTYSGNSTAGHTVSHNLGSAPAMMIIKQTNGTNNWHIYHKNVDKDGAAAQNTALFFLADGGDSKVGYFNNTAPTDSVFTLGSYGGDWGINGSGENYVAYLFADNTAEDADEQMIKCGSYTGNNSASGPYVSLGWEAQFILVKSIGTDDWSMWDTMRGLPEGTGHGNAKPYLNPGSAGAEAGTNSGISVDADGFHVTGVGGQTNDSGVTYIYMAIRAPMMKEPEAATEVYKTLLRTGTNGTASVTGVGFPFDVLISRSRNNGGNTAVFSRITGPSKVLHTNESYGLINRTGKLTSFDQDGFSVGADNEHIVNSSNDNYVYNAFKRAKGFFDVVTYTGDRSSGSRTVAHSLGVVPEMIWVKHTSLAQNWSVYTAATGGTKYGWLNANNEFGTSAGYFNNTNPTDSVFTVGNDSATNATNRPYIAYLFATLAGISKVGTFVSGGSGVTVNVDCGFSNGARFVLIKALTTDSWYFWDTARGIVSGNDSRLSLESTNAAVTNQDNIDPYSAGFSMNGTLIGNSGNTFIFYAIA